MAIAPPTDADRDAVASTAGQCASCQHLQVLRSKTSTFIRCGRSDDDPRYPRYPRLPVFHCPGWQSIHEPSAPNEA
ncbi:MAG: hypothetical protein AAF772_05115 [Acidobacteriota bacterium]